MHIPKGKWRDGIFSCFEDPLLFLSCCFPHGKKSMNIRIRLYVFAILQLTYRPTSTVALSQIRTRLQYRFYNSQEQLPLPLVGTRTLFSLTITYIMLHVICGYIVYLQYPNNFILILICTIPLASFDVVLFLCLIYFTIRTRKSIKDEFDIKESFMRSYDDSLAVLCCMPCAISQMGRHTADYGTYRVEILSDTGFPPTVDSLIPKRPLSTELTKSKLSFI